MENENRELRTDLVALQDFIIVKQIKLKDESIGKIIQVAAPILPYSEAEVVSVGPGAMNNVGVRGIMDLKQGDKVYFFNGTMKLELDRVEKPTTTEFLWGMKHYECVAIKK